MCIYGTYTYCIFTYTCHICLLLMYTLSICCYIHVYMTLCIYLTLTVCLYIHVYIPIRSIVIGLCRKAWCLRRSSTIYSSQPATLRLWRRSPSARKTLLIRPRCTSLSPVLYLYSMFMCLLYLSHLRMYVYDHICRTGSEGIGDGIQRPPPGLERHPARDRPVRGGDQGGREGHGGLR